MDEQLNRELSIVYDLLFGYTDKMKNLRSELDLAEFKLPVQVAMVIKITDYQEKTVGYSNFRREEINREVLQQIKIKAGRISSDILTAYVEEDMVALFFAVEGNKNTDKNTIEDYAREKEELIEFGSRIIQHLEKETIFKYAAGLGRRYDNLKGLIFSYNEALNACKNGHFFGRSGVLHVDDLLAVSTDIPLFLSELEEKLLSKIRSGRVDELDSIFMETFSSIINVGLEPETIKLRVMELVLKIMKEVEKRVNRQEAFLYNISSYLESLLKVETRDELNQLTMELGQNLLNILKRDEACLNNKKEITRALVYINKNYQQELSLKKVSQKAGLSLYYFSHLFKEEVGETFTTYLNKLRINKSKKLLQETDLNIAEISYRVGYNDPNYFTRVFKDYECLTPTQYRVASTRQNVQ